MKTVADVLEAIDRRSPFSAALEWDNVGLLVGSRDWEVSRIYVALDATDEVISRAISHKADLLVTHHPMIFSPLKRIVAEDFIGRRVLSLASHRMAYIAMHTNYDVFGMADLAAGKLGLLKTLPLETVETDVFPDGDTVESAGIGRVGQLEKSASLVEFAGVVRDAFGLSHVRFFGEADRRIERVAICPGSGKSVISLAIAEGADVLVTGDIDHHSGIDAVAQGLAIVDAGHYGVEHVFVEDEAGYLHECFGGEIEVYTEPFAEPVRVVF